MQEPKAKAALIWMLGEYSQDMQDAPYVLESLVENWDDEHSAEVINQHGYCPKLLLAVEFRPPFYTEFLEIGFNYLCYEALHSLG